MNFRLMKDRFFAANEGNIESLDWLKINGCPMANEIPADEGLEDKTVVQSVDSSLHGIGNPWFRRTKYSTN